jgi:hypothetical protein
VDAVVKSDGHDESEPGDQYPTKRFVDAHQTAPSIMKSEMRESGVAILQAGPRHAKNKESLVSWLCQEPP